MKRAISKDEFEEREIGLSSVEARRDAIARYGVQTRFMNRDAVDWAGEVLELAEAGLRRIDDRNDEGDDESALLAPLRALLERGRSPADLLLAEVPDDELLERYTLQQPSRPPGIYWQLRWLAGRTLRWLQAARIS